MVRIRRKLDSETLHLPELKPLIGKTVEITVQEKPSEVADAFWAEVSRVPTTVESFEAQNALLRTWRNDHRFEPYWPVIDERLQRTFDYLRKWAALQAQLPLDDYDYDAIRDQESSDREDAQRQGP